MIPPGPSRLNYSRIRRRAAELGLTEQTLCQATGVHPYSERDPDQRTVTLTVLSRLRTLLGLTWAELVIEPDNAAHEASEIAHAAPEGEDAADATLLLGVLASRGGATTQTVLGRLAWTHARLDAAIDVVRDQLAGTALQLSGTELYLTLTVVPGTVSGTVDDRLIEEDARRVALTPMLAEDLLRLVRQKILAPFPGEPDMWPAESAGSHFQRQTALLNQCIAIGRRSSVGDEFARHRDSADEFTTSYEVVANLQIHPDVMYALGLAGPPLQAG
ncbi:DNA-binding protein [Nocardia sp. FBN12]|uniref:DNA-binding protein n=1 Tax=unclassified Nocardia TaxID=2637762 RepID=UPI003633E365